MKIRRLTIGNYKEMKSLWSRAGLRFKPKGRDGKKAIADQIRTNPDFFLGAFEDGSLIGAVILSSDLRKGWINRLAVDPNYRHCGIARTLIEESEKIFRKHDLKIFCALIEDYNAASRQLFKECGYIEHHDILYFSKRTNETI